MSRLTALDEFFHLDNDKNRANIIVVVKTDKVTDYKHLRNRIIEKSMQFDRTRHSLTKFMGEYFFIEMKKPDLEKAIEKAYILNSNIKSDQDIAKFMAEEQIIREPLDTL